MANPFLVYLVWCSAFQLVSPHVVHIFALHILFCSMDHSRSVRKMFLLRFKIWKPLRSSFFLKKTVVIVGPLSRHASPVFPLLENLTLECQTLLKTIKLFVEKGQKRQRRFNLRQMPMFLDVEKNN